MNLKRMFKHLILPPWLLRQSLSTEVLHAIEAAIQRTEATHGGQIRFAYEATLDLRALWRNCSARERAIEVFSELRVWDTEQNNGVLVYLLLAERDVEIVADRGIDRHVGAAGWEAICSQIEADLHAGDFEQGLVRGIEAIGQVLKTHYPRPGTNELPDEPVKI